MSFSLASVTGAEVQYHVGVFTIAKSTVLGAGALVAIPALVGGILAYLQLIGIPPAAMYALGASGGALLLLTGSGAIYLTIQHIRKWMQLAAYEACQEMDTNVWKNLMQIRDDSRTFFVWEEHIVKECKPSDAEEGDDIKKDPNIVTFIRSTTGKRYSYSKHPSNQVFILCSRDRNLRSIHLFPAYAQTARDRMANKLEELEFTKVVLN